MNILGIASSIIFGLLLSLSHESSATAFTKSEYERNVAITADSCVRKQKSDPANDKFSDPQISEYCECHAKKFYSLTTKEEIDYSNKHKTMNNVKGKMEQAKGYCASMLQKKWGEPATANKSEYIAQFKSNVSSICQKNMTLGDDPVPISIAKPICQCYSEKMTGKLTIEQMKDSDINPNKYSALSEKVMTNCITKATK